MSALQVFPSMRKSLSIDSEWEKELTLFGDVPVSRFASCVWPRPAAWTVELLGGCQDMGSFPLCARLSACFWVIWHRCPLHPVGRGPRERLGFKGTEAGLCQEKHPTLTSQDGAGPKEAGSLQGGEHS